MNVNKNRDIKCPLIKCILTQPHRGQFSYCIIWWGFLVMLGLVWFYILFACFVFLSHDSLMKSSQNVY